MICYRALFFVRDPAGMSLALDEREYSNLLVANC